MEKKYLINLSLYSFCITTHWVFRTHEKCGNGTIQNRNSKRERNFDSFPSEGMNDKIPNIFAAVRNLGNGTFSETDYIVPETRVTMNLTSRMDETAYSWGNSWDRTAGVLG